SAGELVKSAGRDQVREQWNRIVAHVEKIAGDDGPRLCAHISEENAHDDQQRDLPPPAPELRRVQHPEERAGNDDAGAHAETSRDHRINVTAKNRFFEKWRD